jgi:hypothetical protein
MLELGKWSQERCPAGGCRSAGGGSLTGYPGLDILTTRERAFDRRRAALDAVVMERGMSLALLRHLCAQAWTGAKEAAAIRRSSSRLAADRPGVSMISVLQRSSARAMSQMAIMWGGGRRKISRAKAG